MTDTTSTNIISEAIDKAANDDGVKGLEALIIAKFSKRTRGAIYETGKWLGGVSAVVAIVAGTLDGAPALYAFAAASILYSASSFISKANLS